VDPERSADREKLPREVVALGWVSFFTDVSSEMIVPLLPVFLTSVLGAGALALGLVEGFADAVASLLKLFSGRWADRAGRCRPFVVAGYLLSSAARPFVALAAAPWHVVLVRAIDRTGKGIRTSPRDAMIAAATAEGRRGAAFGFHRAMDHAGAMAGPLCAVLLLEFATKDLRTIFWLAAIPGAVAVLVLLFGVRESSAPAKKRIGEDLPWRSSLPDRALLRLLAPLALFTLGNSSDLFLLLNVGQRGSGPVELSLLWIGLHLVKSVVSLRSGPLADRFGPLRLVLVGWLVYAAVYVGFAFATNPVAIVGLCLVYGTYHGLTEGTEKALVAQIAPADRRGAFFGWYHLTVGLLALPASAIFGATWSAFGSRTAFLLGSSIAVLAWIALVVLRPARQ
jgi:MFS family permease